MIKKSETHLTPKRRVWHQRRIVWAVFDITSLIPDPSHSRCCRRYCCGCFCCCRCGCGSSRLTCCRRSSSCWSWVSMWHITLCDKNKIEKKNRKKIVNNNNLLYIIKYIHTDRAGSGRPRVGPGRAKSGDLTPDPMGAGPAHLKAGPTLALLGSGRVGPRANRARPCPWTV